MDPSCNPHRYKLWLLIAVPSRALPSASFCMNVGNILTRAPTWPLLHLGCHVRQEHSNTLNTNSTRTIGVLMCHDRYRCLYVAAACDAQGGRCTLPAAGSEVTTGRPAESKDRAENFYQPTIHRFTWWLPSAPHVRTVLHCLKIPHRSLLCGERNATQRHSQHRPKH